MRTFMLVACWLCVGTLVESAAISRQKRRFAREDQLTLPMNKISYAEQQVAKRLLHDYKMNVRPKGTNETNERDGGPVIVTVTFYLKFLNKISDASMDFGTQFAFQQEWFDSRLNFEDSPYDIPWINLAADQKIWIPDTFWSNEKNAHYHEVDRPNDFTKIRRDGLVIYNRRMSMTFGCNMYLRRYPHDTQNCSMDFATYAYTTDDIKYEWSATNVVMEDLHTQILPKFTIIEVKNGSCTSSTNTGTYSCLKVDLRFQRVLSFYLLQLYIPSMLLVSVSCVSYWIDWKVAPARVPLAIVTLLTMIQQSHSINSALPPVSYTKAIDVWIGACIIFIFCSLLEYAMVNYSGLNEERRQRKKAEKKKYKQPERNEVYLYPPATLRKTGPAANVTNNNNNGVTFTLPSDERFQSLRAGESIVSYKSGNYQVDIAARRLASPNVDSRPQSFFGLAESAPLPRLELPDYGCLTPAAKAERRRRDPAFLCRYLMQQSRAERIDIVSRIFFPLAFIAFNCVYWYIYYNE